MGTQTLSTSDKNMKRPPAGTEALSTSDIKYQHATTVPRVLGFPTHSIPSRSNQPRVFPSTASKSGESTLNLHKRQHPSTGHPIAFGLGLGWSAVSAKREPSPHESFQPTASRAGRFKAGSSIKPQIPSDVHAVFESYTLKICTRV